MSGDRPPAPAAQGWQPDPFRRHELRFNDGGVWTEHVSDRGIAGIDTVPVADGPRSRPPERTGGALAPPTMAGTQVRVVPATSDRSLGVLDALVLVVDDESIAYAGPAGHERVVRDERGHVVAVVRVGAEPATAHALRMLTTDPVPEVTTVDVLDPSGALLFSLDRPTRRLKPWISVVGPDRSEVGRIVPRQLLNGLRYTLEIDGVALALLEAIDRPDRQAWIVDPSGRLLARLATTWEVPSASYHPIADTHLILREGPLPTALATVVLAAMLGLDSMLLAEPPLASR